MLKNRKAAVRREVFSAEHHGRHWKTYGGIAEEAAQRETVGVKGSPSLGREYLRGNKCSFCLLFFLLKRNAGHTVGTQPLNE